MKAALLQAPNHLTVADLPEPLIEPGLGDYDALCQLLFGAVCAGTDQHILHGRFPWPLPYPLVLGHETIGRVVKVGPKVRHLKPGDLVTRVGTPAARDKSYGVAWGGFAQWGLARDHRAMKEDGRPPAEWRGYRINQVLPPDTDPAAATMVITWRETYSYLRRLAAPAGLGGKTLLIAGSGGNGLAFAAHARNAGAARVAMLGSPKRLDAARRLGIDPYLDYRAPDAIDQLKKLRPEGFDILIDAVGKIGELDRLAPLLAPGGTVGTYGIDDYGKITLNPSNFRGTFTYYSGGYDEEEAHADVVALMRTGQLDASVWLDLKNPFPLEKIAEALDAVAQRRTIKSLVRLT